MLTAEVGVGLSAVHRELIAIEVVAPLEEAYDIVLIHLHADGTVAPGGHSDESVGYVVLALAAAIVGPEVGHVVLEEGLDVVVAGDGSIHDTLSPEIVV